MAYRIYLCGDDQTFMGSDCPGEHTLQPRGYIEWHDWAAKMSKTHKQRKCSVCGLWAIWEPKA